MTCTWLGNRAVAGRRTSGGRGARAVVRAAFVVLLAGVAALTASPASAAAPPLSSPTIVGHFDLAAGQQPENITLLPDGSPVVTFSFARQVARIDRSGGAHILATLPAPPPGSTPPPIAGAPVVTGVVRADDGALFVNYAAGTAKLTGTWVLRPGRSPHRIAALPAGGFPNGLALDARGNYLYAVDSVPGSVWRIPVDGGPARLWASGRPLALVSLLGANGIKVHHGAVWVTNTDRATLLRIPVTSKGAAGRPASRRLRPDGCRRLRVHRSGRHGPRRPERAERGRPRPRQRNAHHRAHRRRRTPEPDRGGGAVRQGPRHQCRVLHPDGPEPAARAPGALSPGAPQAQLEAAPADRGAGLGRRVAREAVGMSRRRGQLMSTAIFNCPGRGAIAASKAA